MNTMFDFMWIISSVLEITIKMMLIVIGYVYIKSNYFKNRR